ncbi:hypothetical protein NM688_g139 [Phlebia brevispora]|uniref:Uncharacterized protein n=1 Tax=Phlebia brevispora TaxID=194682 RepID=A0ACC1TEU0_9APHY|nr:hypothetical protein NM688_g139 [Phlebia brevispora]
MCAAGIRSSSPEQTPSMVLVLASFDGTAISNHIDFHAGTAKRQKKQAPWKFQLSPNRLPLPSYLSSRAVPSSVLITSGTAAPYILVSLAVLDLPLDMPARTEGYEVLLDFINDTHDCATIQLLRDYGRNSGAIVLLHPGESVTLVLDAGSVYRAPPYEAKVTTACLPEVQSVPLMKNVHSRLVHAGSQVVAKKNQLGTSDATRTEARERLNATYKSPHETGLSPSSYNLWTTSSTMVLSTVTLLLLPLLVAGKATVNDQIAQLENSNSPSLQYPTQLTQNIVPKGIHSHNDYWRDVPVLTALSFGVASVEADVWLVNGTLFIGHEEQALTTSRTFDSLYVQPILKALTEQNPITKFTGPQASHNGPFDTSGGTPLQLLVDVKTDGTEALPFILQALEPLRSKGYLTTFANGTLTQSAVTVVGTGNSPLDGVKALSPRDYFFDAPLTQLTDPSLNTTWDPTLSPLASTDYEPAVGWNGLGNISEAQLANIVTFVGDAHARGIAARFWDTPGWPIHARNAVWKVLLDNGADWLNADDLQAASEF